MLYEISCAAGALFMMCGAVAAAGTLLWLLCRPKKREPTFAVVRFDPGEPNAAARVSFLLIATALLFGAKNTAVIAVLAPGAEHLRAELSAACGADPRFSVCTEESFAAVLREKVEKAAAKSR